MNCICMAVVYVCKQSSKYIKTILSVMVLFSLALLTLLANESYAQDKPIKDSININDRIIVKKNIDTDSSEIFRRLFILSPQHDTLTTIALSKYDRVHLPTRKSFVCVYRRKPKQEAPECMVEIYDTAGIMQKCFNVNSLGLECYVADGGMIVFFGEFHWDGASRYRYFAYDINGNVYVENIDLSEHFNNYENTVGLLWGDKWFYVIRWTFFGEFFLHCYDIKNGLLQWKQELKSLHNKFWTYDDRANFIADIAGNRIMIKGEDVRRKHHTPKTVYLPLRPDGHLK